MIGYLYYSNQTPIIRKHYYAPGRAYMDQENCHFEEPLIEGDALMIHMGHGQFHRFICVATDGKTALLVASNI